MQFSEEYPLRQFQCLDKTKIQTIISHYPLATLISCRSDLPLITQIPLIAGSESKATDILEGHVDINSPFVDEILSERNVYCVFNGPNGYISPSIYPDEQFPGWSYICVHITGKLQPVTIASELADILVRTAADNEEIDSSYVLTPMQKNFEHLLDYILGFRIQVQDAKAIVKLSQDKTSSNTTLARERLANMATRDIDGFLKELLA